MRDELRLIDVLDRMKGWLLEERSALGAESVRRIEEFEAERPIRHYRERFLAAMAGEDPRSPGALRRLAQSMRRMEADPGQFAEELAEDPAPFYARMSKSKRSALPGWLQSFEALGDDPREAGRAFGEKLRDASGPAEATTFVRETFGGIGAMDARRALQAWDFPLVLPDRRRIALFHRLGFLKSEKTNAAGLRDFDDLAETAHRLSSEPLQALEVWTTIFAGAQPNGARELARCLPRPKCGDCPVASACEFFKHNKPREAEEPRATIRDWDVRQRPRERLARHGAAQLSDAELLAILLRTGTSKSTALELAQLALKRFGGLAGMDQAALGELCAEKGMGQVKAITIKAAFELGRRVASDAAGSDLIHSSFDIFLRYHPRLSNVKREEAHLVCLDTKHNIIHETLVSAGSLANSLVHPREAFKEAVRHSAASVIFIHNHPSGDPTPSSRDHDVTKRLRESAKILGIPLLDHVIIGRNKYYSFEVGRVVDMVDEDEEGDTELMEEEKQS